jgi:hypothetical protein
LVQERLRSCFDQTRTSLAHCTTTLHVRTKTTSLWCFRSWTLLHAFDLLIHHAVARPCSSSAPQAPASAEKLSCLQSLEGPSCFRLSTEKLASSLSSHQTLDHRCSTVVQGVLPTLLCFPWNTGFGLAKTLAKCRNVANLFAKELGASQRT